MIRALALIVIVAALAAGAVYAYHTATAGFERAVATRNSK